MSYAIPSLIASYMIPGVLSFLFEKKEGEEGEDGVCRFLCVKKDGGIVGHIRGSLHEGIPQYGPSYDHQELIHLYQSVKHVFHEIAIPDSYLDPTGYEFLSTDAARRQELKVHSLETAAIHLDTIYSNFLWQGDMHHISFGSFEEQYPEVSFSIKLTALLLHMPGLAVYELGRYLKNRCFGTAENHAINAVSDREIFKKIVLLFTQGLCPKLQTQEIDLFNVVSRDKRAYHYLCETVGPFSPDHKFAIVIGAGHLSTKSGLLSHFKKDGYSIEDDSAYWRTLKEKTQKRECERDNELNGSVDLISQIPLTVQETLYFSDSASVSDNAENRLQIRLS